MKQVLSCVNYCHKTHIVHRDLKPENILLEQNKDFDQIKIIDFGTSLVFDEKKARFVMDELSKVARDRKWKYLEVRGGGRFFASAKPANEFYGHKLDLRGASE